MSRLGVGLSPSTLRRQQKHLTTFITHEGLFRYKRVCFGPASAPSAFQCMMSKILQGMKGVKCYLDDVIVFGANKTEHDKNLRAVFERIAAAGLKLKQKMSISSFFT